MQTSMKSLRPDSLQQPSTEPVPFDRTPLDPRAAAVHIRRLLETAFLLDVDGTLVDIAPTPSQVEATPGLLATLARLEERSGGAVALVSGRTIAELDSIFSPLRLPAVGGHGAEFRPVVGEPVTVEGVPLLDPDLKRHLVDIAGMDPRILIEDKGYSAAVHFRLAPELQRRIADAVSMALARARPSSVEVLHGKAVLEIKSSAYDKGSAVRRLMRLRPFAGRRPIFVGDDTTDETAFAVLSEFDGTGFSVGRPLASVAGHFAGPREVREWLQYIAQAEEPPPA